MRRDPAATWTKQPSFGRSLDVVLVPLDGSGATEAALQRGIAIAERSGAELHIAAAANSDEVKVYFGEGVEMLQPGSREFAELLEGYVADLAEDLSHRCTCHVEACVITAEDPRDGLSEYELRVGVGLTVIGTRVPADFEESGWRSLSSDVARRAASPLLFVPAAGPDEGEIPSAPASGVAAVLVDEAPEMSEEVVRCSASYASLWSVPLLLLDAAAARPDASRLAPHTTEGALDLDTKDLCRTRLERIAGLLRDRGMAVDTRSLDGPDRHPILASVLREEKIDTVATSHASTSLAEWLLFGKGIDPSAPGTKPPEVSVLVCPRRDTV